MKKMEEKLPGPLDSHNIFHSKTNSSSMPNVNKIKAMEMIEKQMISLKKRLKC